MNFVSNFTDVDDKIIKAANELGEDVFEVANKFIEAYHEDTCALGVNKADHHPQEMRTRIATLLEADLEQINVKATTNRTAERVAKQTGNLVRSRKHRSGR